jgi:hypothetical protein
MYAECAGVGNPVRCCTIADASTMPAASYRRGVITALSSLFGDHALPGSRPANPRDPHEERGRSTKAH